MSKYFNHTVILLMTFIVLSCTVRNPLQSRYEEDIKSFPTFLVDHFPNKISSYASLPKAVDTTNDCIFYLYYSYKNQDVFKEKQEFEKKSIAKYSAIDTSLITVKDKSLFEWTDIERKYYRQIVKKNNKIYYPILYFEDISDLVQMDLNTNLVYNTKNPSGLVDCFTIYVFDSKPGTYWKGAKDLDYMPDGWKRGYSKGACINEKEKIVIYWFVVW